MFHTISTRFFILAFLFSALLLTSCGGATKHTGIAIPAIITSSTEHQQQEKVPTNLPHSIAVLPFINRTKEAVAFEVVRRTIFNHFASKNYRTTHWRDVDTRLKAANMADPQQLDQYTPRQLASALGVDGLLYGEITHYDKIFLGIYAQVAVGVRLRLVNRDGTEIWRGEDVVRSHAGGISTTPIGLIMNVIAAAAQVRDINLFRAADELGRNLMANLPEPARLQGKAPPTIKQVVHDGVGRVLKYGDTLAIAMEGAPGKRGFARIQGLKTIDLVESQPGFYTAHYNVGPNDNIDGVAVVGVLSDGAGVQREWISPIGLLTIDNQPPDVPANITVQTVATGLQLHWDVAKAQDVAAYAVMVADQAQGPFAKLAETRDIHFTDSYAQPFHSRYYRIAAIDRAGNRSESSTITATLLQDARLAQATALPETLPATIEGIALLRADHSYRLTGSVEVRADAVLLIEPGVTIIADGNGSLKVMGELQAFGSSQRPIRINGGKQTLVLAGDRPVKLTAVHIDGAAIAITVTAGAPQIVQCVLTHNRYSAMEISGVSRPQVIDSRLEGSSAGGVLIIGKAQPRFSGNLFKDLKPFPIQSSSPYTIDARGNQWQPANAAAMIMGSVDHSQALK